MNKTAVDTKAGTTDDPITATPGAENKFQEQPLAVPDATLKASAAKLPPPRASILDGLSQPYRTEDIQRAIFHSVFGDLANLANQLGYGWVAGVGSNSVGGDYVYVEPGTTVAGSGGYTITGPAFAPNLKQGPNPDPGSGSGYQSDLRTSFEFIDVSIVTDSQDPGGVIDQPEAQPQSITTWTIDNLASAKDGVTSVFTAEVFKQSQTGASAQKTWSDEWHFEVSATATFSGGASGAMFPSASLSVTASGGQSHSTGGNTSTSNSLTNGTTETHSFQHTTPAGYLGTYAIMSDESVATLPVSTNAKLAFGVKIHGFLRWGGGKAFQGNTNYHMQYSGSGDRPTFDAIFGGGGQPFWQALSDQASNNSAPWHWNDMFKTYGSKAWLLQSCQHAQQTCLFPTNLVLAQIERNNIHFKTISETQPEQA